MEGKSVLVVDDNPDFIELVRYNLEKEAVHVKVRRSKFFDQKQLDLSHDVVVADMNLPGSSGLELCRKYKCSCSAASYPFFILLAHEFDQVNFKNALDSGVDDFFMKPVKVMPLIKSILTLIKMQPSEKKSLADLGISLVENVTIEKNSYKVFIENQYVNFNLVEFNLFKLFLCNPGKIFTFGQLYLELNAVGFILGIHSIHFQVDLLRRKLSKFNFHFVVVDDVGFKLEIA